MPGPYPKVGDRLEKLLQVEKFPHTVVFGGFAPAAVRERMEVSRAKALIIPDGARRKGKLIPVKQQVDEAISDLPDLETVVVVRSTGAECVMRPGRDVWFDDLIASADQDGYCRAGSSGPTTCPRPGPGKIMRRLLRDVAEGREPGDVTTLRDASVLTQLQQNAAPGQSQ